VPARRQNAPAVGRFFCLSSLDHSPALKRWAISRTSSNRSPKVDVLRILTSDFRFSPRYSAISYRTFTINFRSLPLREKISFSQLCSPCGVTFATKVDAFPSPLICSNAPEAVEPDGCDG
jgi:hypothetical protein